jgi:hypothetical protein
MLPLPSGKSCSTRRDLSSSHNRAPPISRDMSDPPYHRKISGTFHSLDGAEAFAAIRSYLQTAAKHGENLLGVLRTLFTDGPWIPPPRLADT